MSRLALPASLARRAARLGSMTAIVGLVVLLSGDSIVAKEATAATGPAAKSAEKSKTSAELLAEFRKTYALAEGQAVKRIAPPFGPGRMEHYRVHDARQAQLLPEGPEFMWFRWSDHWAERYSDHLEGKLYLGGMGWVGGKGVPVSSLVNSLTSKAAKNTPGIQGYEMLGDRKLMARKIQGDWVVREEATAEKILEDLGKILREECKTPIRFRLVKEDRKVIVAEGKYVFKPLPGNRDLTDEANIAWDRIDIYEKDYKGHRESWGSNLNGVFSIASGFLQRPILNETIGRPENPITAYYSARRLRACRKKGNADEAAILKHLAEQTGLTFTEKTRKVRVLHVDRVK